MINLNFTSIISIKDQKFYKIFKQSLKKNLCVRFIYILNKSIFKKLKGISTKTKIWVDLL